MSRSSGEAAARMIVAAFPRAEWPPETIALMIAAFEELPPPMAMPTAKVVIDTCKFPPSIAEIKEAATDIVLHEVESPSEAWDEVVRTIGRTATGHRPTFTNPAIEAAVKVVGWNYIRFTSDERGAVRKAFMQEYERQAKDYAAHHPLEMLPGGSSAMLGGG